MNSKEVKRCRALDMVKAKQLKLAAAAEQLGVSYRHAKRLFKRLQK